MSLVTKVVSRQFPLDNSPWTITPQTIALVDNRPQKSGTPGLLSRGGYVRGAIFQGAGYCTGRGLLSIGLLYGGYCPGGYCTGAIVQRAIVWGGGYCTGAIVLELVIKRGLWHFAGFDSASEGHSSHLPQVRKGQNFWPKVPNLLQNATMPHQHT